jgi:hypothetical protein
MNRFTILLAIALSTSTHSAAQEWRTSFIAGVADPDGAVLDASEIRQFVVWKAPDRIYAATSGWMQGGTAKVIYLDAPDGPWRQDVDFSTFCPPAAPKCALATSALQSINWRATESGAAVNVWTLVASTWNVGQTPTPVKVYARNNTDGKWYETILEQADDGAQVRAFATHQDSVTKAWLGFAGGLPRVFTGQLSDKRGAGQNIIKWSTSAEADFSSVTFEKCGGGGRVSGFAEARGKLFLAVCWRVYVRVDGPDPKWIPFWDDPKAVQSESGLRGLTTVTYDGQQVLLLGSEGGGAHMTRLDPDTAQSTIELDTTATLNAAWRVPTGYIIAAYNAYMPTFVGGDGVTRRIVGIESQIREPSTVPPAVVLADTGWRYMAQGWFFIRNAASAYELRAIPPITPQPMVAIRDAVASPFPAECDPDGRNCWVYFGGFDANKSGLQTPCRAEPCTLPPLVAVPTRNTGFIVKGRL